MAMRRFTLSSDRQRARIAFNANFHSQEEGSIYNVLVSGNVIACSHCRLSCLVRVGGVNKL